MEAPRFLLLAGNAVGLKTDVAYSITILGKGGLQEAAVPCWVSRMFKRDSEKVSKDRAGREEGHS